MPLSENEQTNTTAKDIIDGLQTAFGKHAGFRPVHAKGGMVTGTFEPSPEATRISKAPHFNAASTPITMRFSSSTGLPQIPDTDPNGQPRGIAIRFNLPPSSDGRRRHTDVVAHSTPHFPVRSGADFLAFVKAILSNSVPDFLGTHPETVRFVTAPKPFPVSLLKDTYYGLNAFKFSNASGDMVYGRYRIIPDSGNEYVPEEEVKSKAANYLWDDLPQRLTSSGPAKFGLYLQIGEKGDQTDDVTVEWPEERKVVRLGTVTVEKALSHEETIEKQKGQIYDPVPRGIEGLEASDDPLIDMRAAVYLISGRARREAPEMSVEDTGLAKGEGVSQEAKTVH